MKTLAAGVLAVGVGILAAGLAAGARADEGVKPTTVDLWPGQAPGDDKAAEVAAEKTTFAKDGTTVTSITNVTKPTLTVYRAGNGASGVGIVVCPGGGYNNLAWDHEGAMVGRWLNSIGVSAFVLKYRVPRRPGQPRNEPPPQALMDAQRALSLVRAKADDYGVDPKRIGVLGFSAGGHLGAWASTASEKRAYEPVDDSDKTSCRPDFAVLVYPGGVVKPGQTELAPEIKVTSQTPPTFLVHANNDPVTPENSARYYLALKQAGVPAELHIFGSGGHGFGMRPGALPSADWPRRCEQWLRDQKILGEKPATEKAAG